MTGADPVTGSDRATGSGRAGGLTARSITGVLWGVAGGGSRALLQVLAQVVLARLLGPEVYGLFALAVVAVLFSGLIADAGLAYGLIQRRNVGDDEIRFVFTWQVVLGVAAAAALWVWAPRFGVWLGDARTGEVLAMLAPVCAINAIGATAQMLLRRRMGFKTLNLASALSYAIGFVALAIPLALAGFGVWALVAGFVVQALLNALFCYAGVRHAWRPLFTHADARGIVRFGVTALLTSLLNAVLTQLDRLVVGRVLGAAPAGLYATIGNFVTAPSVQMLALLQNVFYSASASAQDSPARLRHGLRSMLGAVALLLAPPMVAVAVVAETFVTAVYGEAWRDGAVVLAALALAMPALLTMGMAVPVLWASGRIEAEFRVQWPLAVGWAALLALLWATGAGSLALFAVLGAVLYGLRAAVVLRATLRAIGEPASSLPALWGAGAVVSVVVGAAAFAADRGLQPVLAHPGARLAAVVAVCAVALFAALRGVRRRVPAEVAALLQQAGERIGGPSGRRWVAGFIA